ncbi:MAG: hypothetical protein GX970_03825 [Phyllobacteriaceae bacterium]|nr:hypothetical protein [Phyllobacteriaceae bacterium]
MSRVVYGAIAGLCATMAMTATMRALHSTLHHQDRYPLPPREITETLLPVSQRSAALATIISHFAYGAAAGAIFGALPRSTSGLVFGPSVWLASYLGWIPGAAILKPATQHPHQRNALMMAAHLVWGGCLVWGIRELEASAASAFSSGPLKDRQEGRLQ